MTIQRTVSGAHYGMRDWLAQRITGVLIALYAIFLLYKICALPEASYRDWALLFVSPFTKVFTLLAVLALIYHAWVGIRDFYMDYLKSTAVRLALHVLTALTLLGYAAWTAVILWSV